MSKKAALVVAAVGLLSLGGGYFAALGRDSEVSGLPNELLEPVVVGATRASSGHEPMIRTLTGGASTKRSLQLLPAGGTRFLKSWRVGRMAELRAGNSRMS
jgi:hypothetical protein